ncbi:MAG: polyprenyl synthetase family protein [Chloroflexota bacterium]
MSLQPLFEHHLPPLENALRAALETPHPALVHHYGMMHYHMGWVDTTLSPESGSSGKRLRPLLCLLVTEATGGQAEQAMPAAVALELLHNFSLVHDDIQDNSATRRGRPAVWSVWGVPQAINVGDGLFAVTHRILCGLAARGVPPDRALAAIEAFDTACVALTEGQFLDMSFEERLDVSLDEYLTMIGGKTAALISVACRLGAIIAGAPAGVTENYARFGQYLGLAFQMLDDWLGVWGEESETGKPVGDDIRERKKNYPVVYALEQLAAAGDDRLTRLYCQRSMDESAVQAVLAILAQTGAQDRTLQAARVYHEQSLAALAATDIQNQAQAWLNDLARTLVSRRA